MTDERGIPFTMPVERGKVREFARATRARSPQFMLDDRASIPPTWLATTALWLEPENRALPSVNLSRTLHGGQEYVFHGPPPRAGDVLTAHERVADRFTKEGRRGGTMTFVVVVTEYRDENGQLVAEARKTLIETSQAAQ